MIKKVIFVGHDNYGSREIFTKVVDSHHDVEFFLIVTEGLYYRKSFLYSIFKLLREASFWFCLIRFIEMLIYKFKGDSLLSRAKQRNVKFIFTSDINSKKTQQMISGFQPDIIMSVFTMHILKKEIIALSKVASIGTHPSILPHYRGLEVFFWALANREKTSGVSVFLLSEKIDQGKVFLQREFNIDADETVVSIYAKLTEITADLLVQAVDKLKNEDHLEIIPSAGVGSYYPMPTREAFKKFKQSGGRWGRIF